MKYILLICTIFGTQLAYAQMPIERFKDLEPTVQMSLTAEPCKAFTLDKGVDNVYRAYVVDTAIGKSAEGCWQLEGETVHIDIVVPDEKSFFSYRYPASDFQLRPDL